MLFYCFINTYIFRLIDWFGNKQVLLVIDVGIGHGCEIMKCCIDGQD